MHEIYLMLEECIGFALIKTTLALSEQTFLSVLDFGLLD
jgi:hypothetical protein